MQNPNDPKELLQYSGEHLMHEISMLWESAEKLRTHDQGTTEYIALLESFATHLRNLIEFLFEPIKRDYVRARHFFEDPSQWKHTRSAEWENLYNRASNEVSHLTTGRIDGNPQMKVWEVGKALAEIEPILKEFGRTASHGRLHPKVRELLRQEPEKILLWIGENVQHSNIAHHPTHSVTPTLSQLKASTATVTVSVLKIEGF
jgi:hypothetical protein